MYYFLLAKDRVGKATVLNLITVFVNAALFFIFYRQYGFYASVTGLCGSAVVAFFLTRFTPTGILQILLVICNTLILSVVTYRYMNLFEKTDIEAYFGSGNRVSRFLIRVFVK